MLDYKKHLMTITESDGTVRKYLPVAIRVAMFREENPQGKILSQIIERGERFCLTEAQVYLYYRDKHPVAVAHAEAKLSEYDDFSHIIEAAETKAIGRALAYAGYGTPMDATIEESETVDTGIRELPARKNDNKDSSKTVNIDDVIESDEVTQDGKSNTSLPAENSSTTKAVPSVAKDKAEAKKKSANAEPQKENAIAKSKAATVDSKEKLKEARAFICPTGEYRGKTLGEIYLTDPKCLEYYSKQLNSQLGEYAKMLLALSPKRK